MTQPEAKAPLSVEEIISYEAAQSAQTVTVHIPEWGIDVEIGPISVADEMRMTELDAFEKVKTLFQHCILSPTFTKEQVERLFAISTNRTTLGKIANEIIKFNHLDASVQEAARPFPVSE